VACYDPSQCPATSPGCDSAFYACGFCSGSMDCPSDLPVCQGFTCATSCVLPDGGEFCDSGICQTSTGACVACLQDQDCSPDGGSPYCLTDIDAGTRCVQCLDATFCGDAGPCNGTFFRCGSCGSNADCPPDAPTCAGAPFGTCSDGG
jgi:hypothetical protein